MRDDSRWGNTGDMQVKVSVPSRFDIRLRTAGGDLEVQGPLSGRLEGKTSGGEIKLGSLAGSLKMATAGGDIEAKNFDGDFQVSTSGGNIRIGAVSGEARVATSGGNIRIEKSGKLLVASTSGGDVGIGDVGGDAKVSTSGGDVSVGKVSGSATLSTAGGNIALRAANGTVEASTSGGDLSLEGITGTVKGEHGRRERQRIACARRGGEQPDHGRWECCAPGARKRQGDDQCAYPAGTQRRTRHGEIRDLSDFKVEDLQKDRARHPGTVRLNGGGETITLETVNGKIEIRKMH